MHYVVVHGERKDNGPQEPEDQVIQPSGHIQFGPLSEASMFVEVIKNFILKLHNTRWKRKGERRGKTELRVDLFSEDIMEPGRAFLIRGSGDAVQGDAPEISNST